MIRQITLKSYVWSKPYLYYLIVYAALLLFFISDAHNKFIYVQYQEDGISDIIRGLFEIIFACLLLFQMSNSILNFVICIFFLFFTFLTGQFLFYHGLPELKIIVGNFKVFNKYIFVFFLYFPMKFIAEKSPLYFQRIVKVFYFILLFNSLLIIIGFVLDISLFRSYPFKLYRFGYSGLIPKLNEATMFCFIAISFIYFRRYKLNLKNKNDHIIMFSPVLLGAKGVYLFYLLLLLYHLYLNKNRLLNFFVFFFSFSGIILYFVSSPQKLNYFIRQTQARGFVSMLLSGRDEIFLEYTKEILRKWNVVNYFFGGQDQTYRMFEMDFFDIFFFFGIIGSLIFFYLYFQTIFNFDFKKSFNIFFVASFIILAFLGGHFFASAVNAIYLCTLTLYMRVSVINRYGNT